MKATAGGKEPVEHAWDLGEAHEARRPVLAMCMKANVQREETREERGGRME